MGKWDWGVGGAREKKITVRTKFILAMQYMRGCLCSLNRSLMETVSADVQQRDLETAIDSTMVAAGISNKVWKVQ